jgi:hypothetical protein
VSLIIQNRKKEINKQAKVKNMNILSKNTVHSRQWIAIIKKITWHGRKGHTYQSKELEIQKKKQQILNSQQ